MRPIIVISVLLLFSMAILVLPRQNCPENMVLIKGSYFEMNLSGQLFENDSVLEYVNNYCIDKFEFPNIEGSEPMVKVDWTQAKSLCINEGKRLCKQIEWQKACQGRSYNRFPYGNIFDQDKCNTYYANFTLEASDKSGNSPNCKTESGVYDMSGNVAEWVDGEVNGQKILRGGALNINTHNIQYFDGTWDFLVYSNDCYSIHFHPSNTTVVDDGFRCCKDPSLV